MDARATTKALGGTWQGVMRSATVPFMPTAHHHSKSATASGEELTFTTLPDAIGDQGGAQATRIARQRPTEHSTQAHPGARAEESRLVALAQSRATAWHFRRNVFRPASETTDLSDQSRPCASLLQCSPHDRGADDRRGHQRADWNPSHLSLIPTARRSSVRCSGRQGVVRITPDEDVTYGLGIAEGVEDALAVVMDWGRPVWAATSAGAIERFPVLSRNSIA